MYAPSLQADPSGGPFTGTGRSVCRVYNLSSLKESTMLRAHLVTNTQDSLSVSLAAGNCQNLQLGINLQSPDSGSRKS